MRVKHTIGSDGGPMPVQACVCGLGKHHFLCMGLGFSRFDGLRSLALLRFPDAELLFDRCQCRLV